MVKMVETTLVVDDESEKLECDNAENYETLQSLGADKDSMVDYEDAYEDSAADMASLQRLAVCRLNNGNPNMGSPRTRLDQEKRVRREIANSNERRRMQSINTGFQSLRSLLPRRDGEKMSKASILQQTADFISALQADKEKLQRELEKHKRRQELHSASVLQRPPTSTNCSGDSPIQKNPPSRSCSSSTAPWKDDAVASCSSSSASPKPSREILAPPKKRKRYIPAETSPADSSDEGVCMMSDDAEKASMSPSAVSAATVAMQRAHLSAEPSLAPSVPPQTAAPQDANTTNASWEFEVLHRQLVELRLALDRERRVRFLLEEEVRKREVTSTGSYVNTADCSSIVRTTATPTLTSRIGVSPSPAVSLTMTTPAVAAAPQSTKQSLDAIVEAIKHLEGEQLFVEVNRSAVVGHAVRHAVLHHATRVPDSGMSSPVVIPVEHTATVVTAPSFIINHAQ